MSTKNLLRSGGLVVLSIVAAGCYAYHLPGDAVSDTADGSVVHRWIPVDVLCR